MSPPPTQVTPSSSQDKRWSGLSRNLQTVPVGGSQHLFLTIIGEFCGTFMFLFFAFGGVMVGKTSLGGDPETTTEYLVFLLFAAISFGASLTVNAWLFYRVTGGLFNPAVTFAFVLARLMNPVKGAALFVTQLLAGICAAAVIDALTPGPLSVANTLGPHVNVARGLFMEMFLTAELILAIFMLAVEKHRATFLAPIGIGLALFIGHIVGIYYTGAGLNPARSLGPAVVETSFPGYHWIYWIGPGLGAILATAFYKLLLYLQYETANPDQDARKQRVVNGGVNNGGVKNGGVNNGGFNNGGINNDVNNGVNNGVNSGFGESRV